MTTTHTVQRASPDPRKPSRLRVLLIVVTFSCGCDPRGPAPPAAAPAPAIPAQPAKPPDVVIFPPDLRVTDEAVNAFVERAMTVCSTGSYEEFRRLWSAQRDPLSRDEFEQGWQAVKTIRVRALQKIVLARPTELGSPGDEEAYVLLTDLSLDPKHPAGRERPKRDAVLLVVRERDQWCLTKAPKRVREWVKERLEGDIDVPADGARSRSGTLDR